MKVEIDYKLAMACAQDEGNRNMRKDGRTSWDEGDWNKAVEMLDMLWPINSIGRE